MSYPGSFSPSLALTSLLWLAARQRIFLCFFAHRKKKNEKKLHAHKSYAPVRMDSTYDVTVSGILRGVWSTVRFTFLCREGFLGIKIILLAMTILLYRVQKWDDVTRFSAPAPFCVGFQNSDTHSLFSFNLCEHLCLICSSQF